MPPMNKQTLELRAPAKINLSLEILYKRSDGFHELRTIMQELAWGDLLRFETMPEGRLEFYCDDPSLPAGPENLAWDAASRLQSLYAPDCGARLWLSKKIPVAAGLGGGSSDAATVLKGLNTLWKLNLELAQLQELAAGLGSDVPFFLKGGTALAEGRGEIITPLIPLPSLPVLLIYKAGFALSTPAVYRALCWDRVNQGGKTGRFATLLTQRDRRDCINQTLTTELLSEYMINDLETGAFTLAGELAELKKELQQLDLHVLLSGSGPTFFALHHELDRLLKVKDELSARGYSVICTEFAVPVNNIK